MSVRGWIGSFLLIAGLAGGAVALAAWKQSVDERSRAAAASQPEPKEVITIAQAAEREYRRTTTAIGTVLAMRSVRLRNEIAGTVRKVGLNPGQIVDEGTVLVALDVSVEEAERAALEATAALAQTELNRVEALMADRAASSIELERVKAERDVAVAQVARTNAIIERKTIRAPFRARVGMADVHEGQYLEEGTELTTLQGVEDAVHVDFAVAQQVATTLQPGEQVEVITVGDMTTLAARIEAVDARVDPLTRNAWVRARMDVTPQTPAPGASVRVRVPVGPMQKVVTVPVSGLRKGPGGDHVFVITQDDKGDARAQMRQVQSGAMLGDEIVVYTGLTPGETVANAGAFKLREGALVVVKDGAPETAGVTR